MLKISVLHQDKGKKCKEKGKTPTKPLTFGEDQELSEAFKENCQPEYSDYLKIKHSNLIYLNTKRLFRRWLCKEIFLDLVSQWWFEIILIIKINSSLNIEFLVLNGLKN